MALFAVDGVEGKKHGGTDDLRLLAFSPDSKRLAYVVTVAEQICCCRWSGCEEYPAIAKSGFVFSPDSRRIALRRNHDSGKDSVVELSCRGWTRQNSTIAKHCRYSVLTVSV